MQARPRDGLPLFYVLDAVTNESVNELNYYIFPEQFCAVVSALWYYESYTLLRLSTKDGFSQLHGTFHTSEATTQTTPCLQDTFWYGNTPCYLLFTTTFFLVPSFPIPDTAHDETRVACDAIAAEEKKREARFHTPS